MHSMAAEKLGLRATLQDLRDYWVARSSSIPYLPAALESVIWQSWFELPPAVSFVPGNQNMAGLIALTCIGKAIDATTVFEIGTLNGLTTLTLARNLPAARFTTIDIEQRPRVYQQAPEATRIEQFIGNSATFDYSPYKGRCDLVYIDGDHSLAMVSSDTNSAFAMLAPGGAIVWDDYDGYSPGVVRYLDRFDRPGLFRILGTKLAVYFAPQALERLMRQAPRDARPIGRSGRCGM